MAAKKSTSRTPGRTLETKHGYRDIHNTVKIVHFDNRDPGERADFISFWSDLLLSGAAQLIAARKVSRSVVEGMRKELERVAHDPNSVFFYAFLQGPSAGVVEPFEERRSCPPS